MTHLTFEEIYWLSRYGIGTSRIINADGFDFDRLYRESPEQFDQRLDLTDIISKVKGAWVSKPFLVRIMHIHHD